MKKEQDTPLTYYILPTASNLLGICFFILSYVKMSDRASNTYLDESVIIPIILFFVASVFSYLAMRSKNDKPRLEKAADLVFMAGLLALSFLSVIMVFEYI
jgi:hypothetical protein